MNQIEELLNNKKKEIKNNYIKIISNLIKSGVNKEEVISLFENYESKKNLYKDNKIYFKEYFNNNEIKHSDFERFRDDLYKIDIKQKEKYILKRLKSNKNLINEETKVIVKGLAEENVTIDFISDVIAKKIASVPNSEVLNNILQEQLDFVRGDWNLKSMKEKTKKNNVEIISEKDNKLVVAINDFKSSSNLGTNNWCLVRNESDYDYYRSSDQSYNQVYFIYDFNKIPENNNSMIAVLVKNNGSIYETYNKSDDLISNKNVIDIEFPNINRDYLKERILSSRENIKNENNKIEELVSYGFYEDVKKMISEEEYKEVLLNLYSDNIGKITLSGGVINFFNELEKNKSEINGGDLTNWLRESVYLSEFKTIEEILKKDFFRNIIKENIKENIEDYETDFKYIFDYIFSEDNINAYKFSKNFYNTINEITNGEILKMNIFDVPKYSENALEFIEKEMPFIKSIQREKDNLEKTILNFVDFSYSEENIENYFKFVEITEKDSDILIDLIEKTRISTLINNKSNILAKIRLPISNIIGKEEFQKNATINKDFLNALSMLNHSVLKSKTTFISDLMDFNIEKLNKEDTHKFIKIFLGEGDKQCEIYNNTSYLNKKLFKKLLIKEIDNLDENVINELLIKINETDLLSKENKKENKKRIKLS